MAESKFRSHPDPATWDDYVDFESTSWPKKDRRHYWIIPSVCFNCESACGILAYVDKETADGPQDRGQPAAPRQPRPHLREGRGHAEPARGSRSDPLSAEPRRRARIGQVAAGVVGRGAHRYRRTHPQGDPRKPPPRNHVPRRPARRGRLRQPRAAGLGPRRPQQPHQRLLVVGAARALSVVRQRSAVARLRERAKRSCCSRRISRPATTSTRTRSASSKASRTARRSSSIDPRLSNTSAKADFWLPAYPGTEGALLLAMVEGAARRGSVRPRVRAHLGRLARLPSRGAAGPRRSRSTTSSSR